MSSSSSTILAVDDRIDNLFVLKEVFAQFLPSCTLLTATSAEEGLAIASSQSLKGAILDVQMPGMDGFEATRRIRDPETNVLNHDIPVIAVTANARKEDAEKCFAAGMTAYVSKPINPGELKLAMENVRQG